MGHFFEMNDLAVGYHGDAIIKDICVQIKQGEIVTLIGPNGSGKSTILKSITRHLPVIGGRVYIGKNEVGKLSYEELSREVAVVLTEKIHPELMTCREVVEMGRYPYTGRMGMLREEDTELVAQAMAEVGIEELADKDFENISDGQRQRVLLARAISQEPEVLVLDEPTSYLDIKYKVELLSILQKMAKEKKTTILMSLHEIDLAEKVSDRVLCVGDGEVAAFGTPEEIFRGDSIQKLYGIQPETYNLTFGSIELPKIQGEPEVFVISSCGSGSSVYRKLQREGIPFCAGILYTNDVDYAVAKALAVDVASEEPFEEIREKTYQRAVALMKRCKRVIICDVVIGKTNYRLAELVKEAVKYT